MCIRDRAGTGLTGAEARARLLAQGVRASGIGETRLRFVTHLDVSEDDIERALTACRRAFAG